MRRRRQLWTRKYSPQRSNIRSSMMQQILCGQVNKHEKSQCLFHWICVNIQFIFTYNYTKWYGTLINKKKKKKTLPIPHERDDVARIFVFIGLKISWIGIWGKKSSVLKIEGMWFQNNRNQHNEEDKNHKTVF